MFSVYSVKRDTTAFHCAMYNDNNQTSSLKISHVCRCSHHYSIERSVSTNCHERRKHGSTTPQHHMTFRGRLIWCTHAQTLKCCRMCLVLMHPALRLLSVSDIVSHPTLCWGNAVNWLVLFDQISNSNDKTLNIYTSYQ